MTDVFSLLRDYPWITGTVSALCIADAVNCVRLGHADWWFPALLAFGLAALVSDRRGDG